MGKLIVIVGPSGVGKTTLTSALAKAYPFQTAYEGHNERPFQALFKRDKRYALANQMDYLLYRAEQERVLRASPQIGLVDGGLDLDFHGFTRLFHARGLLADSEFDLCRRFYLLARQLLPAPDLIIALSASEETIRQRLAHRDRINISSSEDAGLLTQFIFEWLAERRRSNWPFDYAQDRQFDLQLDVSQEGKDYTQIVSHILSHLKLGT